MHAAQHAPCPRWHQAPASLLPRCHSTAPGHREVTTNPGPGPRLSLTLTQTQTSTAPIGNHTEVAVAAPCMLHLAEREQLTSSQVESSQVNRTQVNSSQLNSTQLKSTQVNLSQLKSRQGKARQGNPASVLQLAELEGLLSSHHHQLRLCFENLRHESQRRQEAWCEQHAAWCEQHKAAWCEQHGAWCEHSTQLSLPSGRAPTHAATRLRSPPCTPQAKSSLVKSSQVSPPRSYPRSHGGGAASLLLPILPAPSTPLPARATSAPTSTCATSASDWQTRVRLSGSACNGERAAAADLMTEVSTENGEAASSRRSSLESLAQLELLIESQHQQLLSRGLLPDGRCMHGRLRERI